MPLVYITYRVEHDCGATSHDAFDAVLHLVDCSECHPDALEKFSLFCEGFTQRMLAENPSANLIRLGVVAGLTLAETDPDYARELAMTLDLLREQQTGEAEGGRVLALAIREEIPLGRES